MKLNKIILSAVAIALLMIGCNKTEITESTTPALKAGWDFFEPDHEYKFYSLNSQDLDELIELVVVYDVDGNATIERNILPATGEDDVITHVFGDENSWSFSGDDILFTNDFWLVDFDDFDNRVSSGRSVTVICTCTFSNGPTGDCEVRSGFPDLECGVRCLADSECTQCEKHCDTGNGVIPGGMLIIQATSVTLL